MEGAVSAERATGRSPNPLDDAGLCLLSLDGGGVRGLSTLHILKSLMTQLNHERQKSGASALKPCELFDLIGGTSTGGLIAIMLGRLEMDVDECITAYNRLIKAVFEEKAHRTPFTWAGRVQPRFDSAKLKRAIDDVITSQGHSPTEPFNDGRPRGCKVFVCTAAKDLYGITRLRSYDLPHKPSVLASISEAALATSAATGFFGPVSIGARQFVDGALGVNNPVEEVEGEATDIWCAETGDVKSLVKCLISIGTGNPGKKAVEDNLLKFLSKTLVQITTETEETAKRFAARWRQHLDQNRYFRLNVEQGLQGVGLAEFEEQGRIETATHNYLDDQHQISRVRYCVASLKQKQRKTETTLVDEMKKYTDDRIRNQSGRAGLPCYCIPLLPNKRFVGREEVIKTLRQQLFRFDGGQVVSLAGLGGVGKTQVAFQIAYWTKENKADHSVFWISAMSGASFEQAFVEIAKKLAVRKHSEDEELCESVRRSLESEVSGQWLLVVDNADDMDVLFGSSDNPNGIFQYLPQNGQGRVLLTTRSREVALAVGGVMVELAEMNAQEATALLEKSLVRKELLSDAKTVTALLQELTYLPLAITQAAAYLNRNRVAMDKYVELLRGTEQDVVGLMSREFQDSTRSRESRHAVATTWLVSFQQIHKSDALAADLLAFLSCIDPKSIPQSILPLFSSEEAMAFALGTLDVYAFVTRRGDTDTFDMHSLVHLATRIWVRGNGDAAKVEERAVQHLASIFPPSDYSQRDRWRAYLPHALRMLGRVDTANLEERYSLCLKVGQCLQVDGRIREAIPYLQECYYWRREHLDESDRARLLSQHTLAGAYQANGQVKEAVTLLEEVVQIQKQSLAEDHPDQLASQHELARVYLANGQVREAVALLKEVVQIKEQLLAEDHPDLLVSQHELAEVYQENGQVQEAIALLKKVVQIQEHSLAEDHPSRLASQHALAGAYQANGQIEEALALLKEVVRIREQSLVEDHPSRLTAQHTLAGAYRANGQVEEALALLKEVVRIREQSLAENHPSRLASQHTLAGAYRANGQVNEALALLEEVVRIEEHSLAEDHPDRLASQLHFAVCLWEVQERERAYYLMSQVVEHYKQKFDDNHPARRNSEQWLRRFQQEIKVLE